ncbi:urokinase plasminogen activator surface receptor-like [Lampris incognitus]|uniref:urokinase plasminogen activator surface receptor-like n=1 Tax=Lampris incognitus TaxID=2546036 RepID=UPI0024B54BDD|nr:urokinase plasminogen activator surface receptor-like [Lampris incognitus]
MGGAQMSDVSMKSCAMLFQCINGSINFGITRTQISSRCCSTDLCNSQNIPVLNNSNPNGRRCFTCNSQDCAATLDCLGEEDRCITTKVEVGNKKMDMKGCASKSVCIGGAAAQMGGSMTGDLNCCEGNLCNYSKSIEVSLFLLVTLAVSIVLLQ